MNEETPAARFARRHSACAPSATATDRIVLLIVRYSNKLRRQVEAARDAADRSDVPERQEAADVRDQMSDAERASHSSWRRQTTARTAQLRVAPSSLPANSGKAFVDPRIVFSRSRMAAQALCVRGHPLVRSCVTIKARFKRKRNSAESSNRKQLFSLWFRSTMQKSCAFQIRTARGRLTNACEDEKIASEI